MDLHNAKQGEQSADPQGYLNQDSERRSSSSPRSLGTPLDVADSIPLRTPHLFDKFQQPRSGILHGLSCSFEDYLNISSDYGKYDLVDGILVAYPMADSEHDMLVSELICLFHVRRDLGYFGVSANITALGDTTVFIPVANPRARRPDISIGIPGPPTRGQSSYPKGMPPQLVVEVTSGNRVTDINDKKKDYARAGIQEYLIIDRGASTQEVKACVRLGVLRNGAYQWTKLRGTPSLTTTYFGDLSEAQLLQPARLSKIVAAYKSREMKRKKRLQDEAATAKRREAEAKAREAEAKAREAEARAREKAARLRSKRRKAALKDAGIPVSDSSSSTSPPRKHQKAS